MQRVMMINGCYASIMRTEKKVKDGDRKLPPGLPLPVLPVDYLKDRPEHWFGGEGSYVCPVDSDWGLWFNWSMNNTAEMAVLCSVKGMNPLTGQRFSGYDLQDFNNQCPIHEVPFSAGKLCPKCGFKWPDQNFIAQPNQFFIDGFRMPDGNVRQFYFTEEMAKSIPEKVIGKDDTVPAFGFCFYHLKRRRKDYEGGTSYRDELPALRLKYENTGGHSIYTSFGSSTCASFNSGRVFGSSSFSGPKSFGSRDRNFSSESRDSPLDFSSESTISPPRCFSSTRGKARAEVGLGAGARIKQSVAKARHTATDWEEKPTGVIRVYFVFQEEFEGYAAAGLRDLEGSREGYLEDLPVGGQNE